MKSFIPEFVLPEKWYLNITKQEYCSDLNKFLHNNCKHYNDYRKSWTTYSGLDSYFHYPQHKEHNNCHSSWKICKDYKEITFEQFKKYVLKEPIKNKSWISKVLDNAFPSKEHSLETIEEALLKEYDQDDVNDIIKTLIKYLK